MESIWEQSEEIPEGQLININLIYLEGKGKHLNFFQERNDKIGTGLLEDSWTGWFGEGKGRREGDQSGEYYNSQ